MHQLYQSNQVYYNYSKNNKKRIYLIDDKAIEDQLEGFHIIFDVDKEDITYLDKGFDKVIINFVRIETFCLKCYSSFPLESKLYKYIKADCIKKALLFFSI